MVPLQGEKMNVAFAALCILFSIGFFGHAAVRYAKKGPLGSWSFERSYYLAASWMWSSGFLLMGIAFLWVPLQSLAYIAFGISWFFMIPVPCSSSLFNTNATFINLRILAFSSLGTHFLLQA